MKGIGNKLKRNYVGPFKIVEGIGAQSYKLELSNKWKIHNIFYISLLKLWNESEYMQVSSQNEDAILEEPEEETYEIGRLFRCRNKRVKNKMMQELLVLCASYPLEELKWEPEESFTDCQQLFDDLVVGNIPEER